METYKDLGTRYLKQHRRRSILTIVGCMIVAACLFAFLNFICNWIENLREETRKENDFEILILTDEKEKIEGIVNEDFVTSAYLGKAYSWTNLDDGDESDSEDEASEKNIYANALHINVNNIFLVKYYNRYIKDTYSVRTELNNDLLWTYCMDDEGLGYVFMMGGVFIAFIFAIIGVGIIRNSVQLSSLERVKDYGNLRCIGATKKQVRAIVFRESFILETIGIAGGIVIGYILSIPFCYRKDYPIGFHFLPIVLVMITFYGDMYFAIGDGVKKVLNVSPVEAVKGNYLIKYRRIRRRSSGIWKLIFGVEGDYAFKNIKRNNGRFLKTTFAMAFGLGTVVVLGGFIGFLLNYIKEENSESGYYQQYIEAEITGVETSDELKAQLYSDDALKKISSAKGIDATKYIYGDKVYISDREWLTGHMDPDFMEKAVASEMYSRNANRFMSEEEWEANGEKNDQLMKAFRDSGKGLIDYEGMEIIKDDSSDKESKIKGIYMLNYGQSIYRSSIGVYGYDKEDYARYKDNLVEGTLNLSKNGVLLINYARTYVKDEYSENYGEDYLYAVPEKQEFRLTDLKVGDEIQIVDPELLEDLVQEELKRAKVYDEKMHQKAKEWDRLHGDEKEEDGGSKVNPYNEYIDVIDSYQKCLWIIESARQKLAEEGKFKTYVIEGILSGDANRETLIPSLILPEDNYFAMTGKTENDFIGFNFHVGNIFSSDLTKDDFVNALHETYVEDKSGYFSSTANMSLYLDNVRDLVEGIKQFLMLGLIIVIVVLVSSFNTMNAAISNIQLRKNEFAQLRAMGMTKKGLLKAVILEGGIVWIISSVIGIVIGIVIEYILYDQVLRYVIASKIYIAWVPIIIAMLLEFIILCGTNIVCFRDMKLNIANELTRCGE